MRVSDFFDLNAQKTSAFYAMSGVYCIIVTVFYMHFHEFITLHNYKIITSLVFGITLISGTLLSTHFIWLDKIELFTNHFPRKISLEYLWNIAIFFALPILSMLFFVFSGFSFEGFAIATLNLFMYLFVSDKRILKISFTFYILFGISLYKTCGFFTNSITTGGVKFYIFFAIAVLVFMNIAFIRPCKKSYEDRVDSLYNLGNSCTSFIYELDTQAKMINFLEIPNKIIMNNLMHELRIPINNVRNFSEFLNDFAQNMTDNKIKKLSLAIENASHKVSKEVLQILDVAIMNKNQNSLSNERIDLSKILINRLIAYKNIYAKNSKVKFNSFIDDNVVVTFPSLQATGIINILIHNIFFCAYYSLKDTCIAINLKSNKNKAILSISAYFDYLKYPDWRDMNKNDTTKKEKVIRNKKINEVDSKKENNNFVGIEFCKLTLRRYCCIFEMVNDCDVISFIVTIPNDRVIYDDEMIY